MISQVQKHLYFVVFKINLKKTRVHNSENLEIEVIAMIINRSGTEVLSTAALTVWLCFYWEIALYLQSFTLRGIPKGQFHRSGCDSSINDIMAQDIIIITV